MTKRFAILNEQNYLVGFREAVGDSDTGIDAGDLPGNGTYKYDPDRKSFIPLGHGFGKIKAPAPFSTEYILAKLIETSIPDDDLSGELREWKEWYDTHYLLREDELATARRNR